jgi:hypothetical protein
LDQRFVPSVHRLALWAGGPVMTGLYIVGWVGFARMVPTPSPSWSAPRLDQWLAANHTGMLVGCLLMITGCGLWGAWVAAISVWTFRTESRFPVLTFTQLVCVGAGTTFFIFDTLFWTAATFRAGATDPRITQALWDIGWLGFLITIPVYIAWAVAWSLGVLLNPPDHQIFPRWSAYVTLGSVVLWTPSLLTMLFKEGPFSYSGVAGMWLPITEFFVWLVIVDINARLGIRRQEELARREGFERGTAFGLYPPERQHGSRRRDSTDSTAASNGRRTGVVPAPAELR